MSPSAKDAIGRALATLDAADATIIAGTHQAGLLRWYGERELAAIDALEADVVNPYRPMSQMLRLFVVPEIERRIAAGIRRRRPEETRGR
jgi:hypothetical protein